MRQHVWSLCLSKHGRENSRKSVRESGKPDSCPRSFRFLVVFSSILRHFAPPLLCNLSCILVLGPFLMSMADKFQVSAVNKDRFQNEIFQETPAAIFFDISQRWTKVPE